MATVIVMSECILWTGATNGRGYGQVRHDGRVVYVHRRAWEHVNGAIPDGLTIDHLCANTLCTNVAHMELVTLAENTARQQQRLRDARGGGCRAGHPPTEPPLYDYRGRLTCRQCRNAGQRRYRAMRRTPVG